MPIAGRVSAGRHVLAWTVSAALHVLVVVALVWVLHPFGGGPSPDPERLTYVEPAPPPPPPLVGPEASLPDERARPPEEHAPTPDRLLEPAKPAKDVPARREPRPVPAPPKREPAKALSGESGGIAGGTTGGAASGKLGGTVGGHGEAPIAAALAAHPPVVVSRVVPEYPAPARAQRIEGQVLLRAVVDRTGRIEDDIVVARSVPLLDAAAVAALRQWRFTPGRDEEGHDVRVLIEVPIRFQLR